jgi:steroid-22-oyl-CoA synthetase
VTTVAELLLARADDPHVAIRFEDEAWTYVDYVVECAARAAHLTETLDPAREPHLGVLLDNTPDFCFWLGAAAFVGATVVGINPTRRGAELARDIAHTECQLIVTESRHLPLLDGVDHGLPVINVDGATFAPAPPVVSADVDDARRFLLLFTSGTTAAPKAVICTQGRLARIATVMVEGFSLVPDDVSYCAMPLFHGNALMTSWAPILAAGATLALRRKFSASGFLPDVRKYGVTYFNYVGRPLAYILATPEQPDDADNPLQRVFGNEASEPDMRAFEKRFGCWVSEGYGSSEGGIAINRTPETPVAALGPAPDDVVVLDPDTAEECPRAVFDSDGRLLNGAEAIGELVHLKSAAAFEGYWRNDDAMAARVRGSAYWSGDLCYVDESGYVYFAGRGDDWIRVDGENIAAAPIERILVRHPDVLGAVVYAVPDPQSHDLVMAALELRAGAAFDPITFAEFLIDQHDLGTKAAPRIIRIIDAVPVTATMKTVRRDLRRERWRTSDAVWWRPERDAAYRPMTADDIAEFEKRFAQHGRAHILDA